MNIIDNQSHGKLANPIDNCPIPCHDAQSGQFRPDSKRNRPMKPSRKVWVLSTEYNEYDQHGAYFVAVFAEKPSVKQLAEVLQGQIYLGDVLEALALIEHIREGGGRRDSEDQWFNLDEEELK